jgi:hypothetical protein
MDGLQHNGQEVARAFIARGEAYVREVHGEMLAQAGKIAAVLRMRAAKFRSELANSINVEDTAPEAVSVIVGSDHGWFVEHGVQPGGKGLPRFFDPAAADMQAWLMTKLRGSARSPKRGSAAFQSAERALRDAYEGMAWNIRHFGVKAQPFVEPTAREMAVGVAEALRGAIARAGAAGGAA